MDKTQRPNGEREGGVLILPSAYPLKTKGPFCIEYCSGNGDWIVERAKQAKEKVWIALDKKWDRVRKIWSKKCNEELSNLKIVCGEALEFTKSCLLEESIEEIYVNFPDPWPKRRHAKYRLFQPSFVEELARVVKRGGSLTLVTDDAFYTTETIKEMLKSPSWKSSLKPPYFTLAPEDYGFSWFGNLWKTLGKTVYYARFERQ